MGVLTDLIVADEAQADEIGRTHPKTRSPAVTLKGFDQIKGATLWCILKGEDTRSTDRVLALSDQFTCLYQRDDGGPWIYRFPDAFTKLLTEIDDSRFDEFAVEWSKTDEFEGWPLDDIRFFLEALYDTAASAEASGKSILMWVCL